MPREVFGSFSVLFSTFSVAEQLSSDFLMAEVPAFIPPGALEAVRPVADAAAEVPVVPAAGDDPPAEEVHELIYFVPSLFLPACFIMPLFQFV